MSLALAIAGGALAGLGQGMMQERVEKRRDKWYRERMELQHGYDMKRLERQGEINTNLEQMRFDNRVKADEYAHEDALERGDRQHGQRITELGIASIYRKGEIQMRHELDKPTAAQQEKLDEKLNLEISELQARIAEAEQRRTLAPEQLQYQKDLLAFRQQELALRKAIHEAQQSGDPGRVESILEKSRAWGAETWAKKDHAEKNAMLAMIPEAAMRDKSGNPIVASEDPLTGAVTYRLDEDRARLHDQFVTMNGMMMTNYPPLSWAAAAGGAKAAGRDLAQWAAEMSDNGLRFATRKPSEKILREAYLDGHRIVGSATVPAIMRPGETIEALHERVNKHNASLGYKEENRDRWAAIAQERYDGAVDNGGRRISVSLLRILPQLAIVPYLRRGDAAAAAAAPEASPASNSQDVTAWSNPYRIAPGGSGPMPIAR